MKKTLEKLFLFIFAIAFVSLLIFSSEVKEADAIKLNPASYIAGEGWMELEDNTYFIDACEGSNFQLYVPQTLELPNARKEKVLQGGAKFTTAVYKWNGTTYEDFATGGDNGVTVPGTVAEYKVVCTLTDSDLCPWSDDSIADKTYYHKVVVRTEVESPTFASYWKFHFTTDGALINAPCWYCEYEQYNDRYLFADRSCDTYLSQSIFKMELDGQSTTAYDAKLSYLTNYKKFTIEIIDIEHYKWKGADPSNNVFYSYFSNSLVNLLTQDGVKKIVCDGNTIYINKFNDELDYTSAVLPSDKYTVDLLKMDSSRNFWDMLDDPYLSDYTEVQELGEACAAKIKLSLFNEEYRWSDTFGDEDKEVYVILPNEQKALVTPTISDDFKEEFAVEYDGTTKKFFKSDIDFTKNKVFVNGKQVTSNSELAAKEIGEYVVNIVPKNIFEEGYKNFPGGVYYCTFEITRIKICRVNGDDFSIIDSDKDIKISITEESTIETRSYYGIWQEDDINFFRDEIKALYKVGGVDVVTIEEYKTPFGKWADPDAFGSSLDDFILVAENTLIKYKFVVTILNHDYVEVVSSSSYKPNQIIYYFTVHANLQSTYVGDKSETYCGKPFYPTVLDYADSTMTDEKGNEVDYALNAGVYYVSYKIKPGYEEKFYYQWLTDYEISATWDGTKWVYCNHTQKITINAVRVTLNSSSDFSYDAESKKFTTTYDSTAQELFANPSIYYSAKVYKVVEGKDVALEYSRYATNAGTYHVVFSLNNPNYVWSRVPENFVLNEKDNTYVGTYVINKRVFTSDDITYTDSYEYDGSILPLTFAVNFNTTNGICFDYKTYMQDDLEHEKPVDLKNQGSYVAVIGKINNENYTYDGGEFEIEVSDIRLSLSFAMPDYQYGSTYQEIVDSLRKTISTYKISEDDKNEILNHAWAILDAEGKKVEAKDVCLLEPGYYTITFENEVETEPGAKKEYVYESSYYGPNRNYRVALHSELVITKRTIEIDWALDDFEYDGTDQSNKLTASFVDQTGTKRNLVVESTNQNVFKDAGEYRYVVSFDASYDTKDFVFTDYYTLPVESQKVYTIRKQVIDWDQVEFANFKIEYEEYLANLEANYEELVAVKGLPEEVSKVYDLSSVRAYYGKYDITVTLSGANFDIPEEYQVLNAKFIVGAKKQVITKETTDIAIIETNEDGDVLDPTLKLVVESVDELVVVVADEIKSSNEIETTWTEQVMAVYDVSLIDENNIKQQPDGTLKVSLQIPEEILGGSYRIFHRHTDENGNVTLEEVEVIGENDGYAVFLTDKLSEFIFVYKYVSLIWLMIVLGVLCLGAIFLLAWQCYRYVKKNGNPFKKKNAKVLLSAAPIFYMPGHVEAVTAIAIVLGVLLLLNLLVFLYMKGYLQIAYNKVKEYLPIIWKKVKEFAVIAFNKVKGLINKLFNKNGEDQKKPVEAKKPETVANNEAVTLKESLAKLETVTNTNVSKVSIADYLKKEHKANVIVNHRDNYTKASSKNKIELPLADTHYVVDGGKKTCFTYVYENKNGSILVLLKTNEKHFNALKANHSSASFSKFPKVNEGNKWYSLPIDESYSAKQVYEMLSEAMKANTDPNYNAVVSEKEANDDAITLKESLAKLEAVKNDSNISKVVIANYLSTEFKDSTVVNHRENYTKASSKNKIELPLADTHYVISNGKKVCFTYVYENKDGNVLILLKTSKEHFDNLKGLHSSASFSKFPKVNEGNKWYSLPIDETYSDQQVFELLREAMKSNQDENYVAVANSQDAWIVEKQEQLKTMTFEEKDDPDGIDVIGVFFKNRENKIYYFAYNDEDFTKGEVASYSANEGDNRKVVVAIPKIKRSESKLHLPLKTLNKLQ